jgi:hypothetical protein
MKPTTVPFLRVVPALALSAGVVFISACGTSPGSTETIVPHGGETDVGNEPTDVSSPDDAVVDSGADSENIGDTEPSEDTDDVIRDISEDELADSTTDSGVCEVATIQCSNVVGEAVTGTTELNVPRSSDIECRLLSASNLTEPVRWVWQSEGDTRVTIAESPSSEDTVSFFAPTLASGQIYALFGECEVPGPRIQFSELTDVDGIYVSWVGEGYTDFVSPDVDLHVRQSADACWNDVRRDLFTTLQSTPEWGEPAEPRDNPTRGTDSRGATGIELATWTSISSSEMWAAGVEIRPLIEGQSVTVNVLVVRNGAAALEATRRFEQQAWWNFTLVDDDSTDGIDDVTFTAPECAPRGTCDGRPIVDETCNGLDDDCDGTIDEDPEACFDEGDTRCARLDDGYRCVNN